MKKSEKSKLDDLARKQCKKLAGYKCVRCGKKSTNPENKSDGLDWCHVISRTYLSIRWSMRNCLCMCYGCHSWAHRNPTEFTLWLLRNFGDTWYNELYVWKTKKKKLFFDEVASEIVSSKKEDALIPKTNEFNLKLIEWN